MIAKAYQKTPKAPGLPVELLQLILVEHAACTLHSACLGLAPYHLSIEDVLHHALVPATVSRTFRILWVKCLTEMFDIPVIFTGTAESDMQYNMVTLRTEMGLHIEQVRQSINQSVGMSSASAKWNTQSSDPQYIMGEDDAFALGSTVISHRLLHMKPLVRGYALLSIADDFRRHRPYRWAHKCLRLYDLIHDLTREECFSSSSARYCHHLWRDLRIERELVLMAMVADRAQVALTSTLRKPPDYITGDDSDRLISTLREFSARFYDRSCHTASDFTLGTGIWLEDTLENDIIPDLIRWQARLTRRSPNDGLPDYENGEAEAFKMGKLVQDLNVFLGHPVADEEGSSTTQIVRKAKERLLGLGWWIIMLAIFLRIDLLTCI